MGAKKCSGTNPPSTYGLRQIRWYRKASLCTNSPSTYGYTTNPMVRLTRSSQMSTIHIKSHTKSDGAPRQKCLNRPHPFLFPSVSDGASGKKCLNGLHPHQATLEIRWAPGKNKPNKLHPHRKRSKSDGPNRHQKHKSAKKAPQKPLTRSLQQPSHHKNANADLTLCTIFIMSELYWSVTVLHRAGSLVRIASTLRLTSFFIVSFSLTVQTKTRLPERWSRSAFSNAIMFPSSSSSARRAS